jgi:tetratricopeptide (TPR) repeat protein
MAAAAVLAPAASIAADAQQIETRTTPKSNRELPRASLLPFLQEAVQDANALKDARSRAEMLSHIAMARARLGDQASARTAFQEAVRTADAIEDASRRVCALENIAVAQIGSNDRPAALATMRHASEVVKAIGNESGQKTARMWIVRTYARGGDVDAALHIAGVLPESFRAQALANVLEGLGPTGKPALRQVLPSLLQVGTTIKNSMYQAECLRRLAEVLADAGDLEATSKVSEILQKGIAESGIRTGQSVLHHEVFVLAALAKTQARAGNRAGAVETFKKAVELAGDFPMEGEDLRSGRLEDLVRARVDAGDIDGALQTAELIVYEYHKANALIAIAEARAKAGRRDEARDLFRKAIRTAREIRIRDRLRDRPGRSYLDSSECLRTIAFIQARAGFIAEAIQTAESIEEPKWKNSALALIAAIMARGGEARRAAQLIGRIDDESSRNYALQGIAEGRAEAGDMPGALEWVRSRATPEARANACLGVARAVAKKLAAND